jgi:hypothetical protein
MWRRCHEPVQLSPPHLQALVSCAATLSWGGGYDTKNRHLKCKVVHTVAGSAIAAPNASRVVKLATLPVLSMPKAGDHRLIESSRGA